MARRVSGDLLVRRRPGRGAVITIKSATGGAIEIERNAAQVAELVSALSVNPSPPVTPAAEEAVPEPVEIEQIEPEVSGNSEENTNA